MITSLFLILGLAAGFIVGWLMARSQTGPSISKATADFETRARVAEAKATAFLEQNQKAEALTAELRALLENEKEAKAIATTRFEESLKNVEAQRKILEEAQERFKTAFEALSGEALKSNNKAFLDLAAKSMDVLLKGAENQIGEKTNEIRGIVSPLEKTLERYEHQIGELEKARATAYGSLDNQIKSLISSQQVLEKETGNLVSALRTPHVRGQWGQISLKRVVELSGMSEHCDYKEQVSVKVEESRLQPDMIIHLPGGKQVVIDSKVSLHAYMDYIEASEEPARKAALVKHAQQIRKHMNDLASKSYWSQFPQAPEFVIMFIPGEPFVSAAVQNDPTLIEEGVENRIIISTPTTLITLLRAISYGWRQEQVAKNTQQIADLGRQVYERFSAFLSHLTKTRNSLEQSIFNFNRTVASLEGRVLPSLRRFKELGATGADDLPSVEPIEQSARQVEAPERDLLSSEN